MEKRIIEIKAKNGTVYLYEDVSYWDKEKGYSTHDRTCIGKKGPDGKPIYNKYYKTREEMQALTAEAKSVKTSPQTVSSTTFVGETLILNKVSDKTDISRILTESFGDRGFYSEHNIELLSTSGYKFTIPVPSNIGRQKKLIAEHRDSLVRPDHLIEENGSIIYGKTIYKATKHGRTWYHLYFDPGIKDKVIVSFMQKIRGLKEELEEGLIVESHKSLYDRYCVVKETPVHGRKVNYNDEAIQEFINNDSCYWVLISTSAKTASEALVQYRERKGVELYFDDEKNLLDLKRLKNHNEQTIRGKVFVTFVSLIILAALRKKVDEVDKKKRKHWSEHDMLRKVETYTKIHFEGKYKDVYSTPTNAQRLIFDILQIPYTFKGKDYTESKEK